MTQVVIRDFLLKLGFDSKEVEQGMGKLEKRLMKFNSSMAKASASQVNSTKRSIKLNQQAAGAIEKIAKANARIEMSKKAQERIDRKVAQRRRQEAQEVRQQGVIDRRRSRLGNSIARGRNAASFRLQGLNPELANKLSKEFKKLGMEARKASTAAEFTKISNDLALLNQRASQAVSRQKQLNKEFRVGKFAAQGLSDSLRNMARSYVSVFAIVGGGVAGGMLGQNLIAGRAALLGASGSAEQAAKDFEFLKMTSAELGIGLNESVKGFARVGAAARSSGASIEQARETFLAAQEVSAAFNLTADDSAGIFRAKEMRWLLA